MALFDRAIEVTIGKIGSSNAALLVTDLRVTFSVEKDAGVTSNIAEIAIYNLSKESRKRLQEQQDADGFQQIQIVAGYGPGSGREKSLMFLGDVIKLVSTYEAPDFVTRITAYDGQVALNAAQVTVTVGPKASAIEVLKTVAATFKLPMRTRLEALKLTDVPYPQGFQASGPSTKVLSEVAGRLGLEWSVQNGELKLLKRDGTDSSDVVVLSQESGLVGRPEEMFEMCDRSEKKEKARRFGWRATSLLLPSAEPGGVLKLESGLDASANGVYRVERVSHRGDTHGGSWESTVEMLEKVA